MTNYFIILIIAMVVGMVIAQLINIKSPMKIAFLVILLMILLSLVIPEEGEAFNNIENTLFNKQCDFTDRVSDADYRITSDGTSLRTDSDIHLKKAHNNYHELSQMQINYKDCSNFESGDQSCLIPNPIDQMNKLYPKEKSLLVSGIGKSDDYNSIIREDFNYYKDYFF
tara:strand:- start:49 stop:555 length:507 start_codon:yes stop_codon:yes gene_type:complete